MTDIQFYIIAGLLYCIVFLLSYGVYLLAQSAETKHHSEDERHFGKVMKNIALAINGLILYSVLLVIGFSFLLLIGSAGHYIFN